MTMKIPTGCMFTHIIRGSGKKISYQNAGVDCAFVGALSSGFCNWRIDFTYADTSSRNLPDLTRQDPQQVQDRPDCGTTLRRHCLVTARRVPGSTSPGFSAPASATTSRSEFLHGRAAASARK
ncbi:hypothetical protein [Streptomyces bobili]|uniref:hypothetical protein n=1 Tax=Streptomyces bobili TaxID=67280 RepID=UPI001FC97605|nr:hypothetical protein [Streptomyces bobili]